MSVSFVGKMRSSNDDDEKASTTTVYNNDEPIVATAGVSAAGFLFVFLVCFCCLLFSPWSTRSHFCKKQKTTMTIINKTEEVPVLLKENNFKVMMIKDSRLRSAQLMRQAMLLGQDKKLKDGQEEKLVKTDHLLDDDDDPDLVLIKMLKFEQQQLRKLMRSVRIYQKQGKSLAVSPNKQARPTSTPAMDESISEGFEWTAAAPAAAGGMPEPTSILSGETETTTIINKMEEMIKDSRLRSAQLMRQAMLLTPDKKLKDAQEEKLVEFINLLKNVADDDTKLLLIKMLHFEQQQLREFMTSVRIYQMQVKYLALSFDKDDSGESLFTTMSFDKDDSGESLPPTDIEQVASSNFFDHRLLGVSGGIPEPTSILFGETKTMTTIINKTEEEAAVLLEEKDFKVMIKDSRYVELLCGSMERYEELNEAAPLKPVVEALNYPIKKTIQGIKSIGKFLNK